MATSILRSFTFRAEKRIPRSFERLAKRPTRQNRVASYVFPSFIRLRKRLLRLKNARSFQHEEHLRAIRLYSIGVYYSLDVVLLLATGILPEKEPVHFHFMHNVKAAVFPPRSVPGLVPCRLHQGLSVAGAAVRTSSAGCSGSVAGTFCSVLTDSERCIPGTM